MEYKIRITEDSGELMHYGVLGMKWGVRRGDNSKGSSKEPGKFKKRMMKGYALGTLRTYEKEYDRGSKTYNKSSQALAKRADKAAAKGKTEKANKLRTRSESYAAYGKAYANELTKVRTYMSDIKSDKLKAGKDYVAKSTMSYDAIYDSKGNEKYRVNKSYTYIPL